MNGLGKSQKKVAIISTIASEALASEIDAQVACSLLRILLNEIGLTTEDADVRSLDSLCSMIAETTGKNAREIFTSEQRNQFTDEQRDHLEREFFTCSAAVAQAAKPTFLSLADRFAG